MDDIYYSFIEKSSNRKLGNIPVLTTSRNTCPTYCGLYTTCYAGFGPLNIHWKKISNGERGFSSSKELFHKINGLSKNQVWRINQAGDLPSTKKGTIDRNFLNSLIKSSRHTKPICFTHHNDFETIKLANKKGLNLIFSLNNLNELGNVPDDIPLSVPVNSSFCRNKKESLTSFKKRVKEPLKNLRNNYRNYNKKMILCPATYMEDMTCEKCKICTKLKSDELVMFPSHGIRKNKLNETL